MNETTEDKSNDAVAGQNDPLVMFHLLIKQIQKNLPYSTSCQHECWHDKKRGVALTIFAVNDGYIAALSSLQHGPVSAISVHGDNISFNGNIQHLAEVANYFGL